MTPFVLVTGDFVRTGGMDRANFALADYLARAGRPVHLVAHRADAELLARPGVTLHRVPKPAGSYFLGAPLLDRAGRWWAVRAGGRAVVNGGNCRAGDVNWAHYVHAAYDPGGSGGVMRRVRGRLMWATYLRAERRCLRRARLVIANSELTRRHLIERLGLPPERVRVAYYGIDPDRFRPATADERAAARAELGLPVGRPAVVFVGALGDRRKGFDTLFEAWRSLCKSPDWDAVLLAVGAGAELPRWRDRAAVEGLDGSVRFLGFRSDVPRVLSACDLLVAPTRYEAYGLGVHEAVCCGLPALVSASAGVAERYPEALRDLLLPDPDDASDLAARLRRWRNDPTGYAERVVGFAAELRGRTWDDMAAEMLALIERDIA